MSVVTYDGITGNAVEKIDYVGGATDTTLYPDSNNISILGPLWLPRVYGKDLTAFEIASSGKLSIVINDVHALDVSKTGRVTQLSAKSNDSFQLSINSNNMSLTFDATSNDIVLLASNDITIGASNNMIVSASNNFNLDASNDLHFVANVGLASISAASANNVFTLGSNTNETHLYSSNSIFITTSNDYKQITECNIDLYANTGRVFIVGPGSNTSIIFNDTNSNDVLIYSSNNTKITTSNDFIVQTHSNVSIDVISTGFAAIAINDSNVHLLLNGNSNTTTLYSSNDIDITTSNNYVAYVENDTTINTNVGTLKLTTNSDNTYLQMNNSNVTLYTSSNIQVAASNNLDIEAASNIGINALNKSLSLAAHASNMFMTMDSATDVVTLYGSNGLVINTSNNIILGTTSNIVNTAYNGSYSVYAHSNATLYADTSNLLLEMLNNGNKTFNIYSASNINVTASNTLNIFGESNVFITSHSNIKVASSSNMLLTASNNILVSSSNNVTVSACNDLTLSAFNLNFQTTGDTSLTALSNFKYYISSAPDNPQDAIFQITGSNIAVRGDLFITGAINTTGIINTTVVEETLKVNDKLIHLATVGELGAGDSNPLDGVANNGAGIQIDGIPSSQINSNANWPLYEKSIKWLYNVDGYDSIGTSNIEKESCWEVMGGGLRITRNSNISGTLRKLSFTWRIGHDDELELVKTWWNGSNYIYKRIAKFGRVLV
jgi:uncharacterized protein (DUF2345 family)